MAATDEQKQEEFTTGFYYSSLYNSLVLFASLPEYLQTLHGPGFDVPFEMETELDYAFGDFIFNENFRRGSVMEGLRPELLRFKDQVDLLPAELWCWEEI